MNQKQALFVLISIGTIFLFALAFMNYYVNPFSIYSTTAFKPLRMTHKTFKLWNLKSDDLKPEVLIVGSSRSFKVSPAYIQTKTGLTAYNAALSGWGPEYFFQVLNLATQHKKIRWLILGLDLKSMGEEELLAERFKRITGMVIKLFSYEQSKASLNLLYRVYVLDKPVISQYGSSWVWHKDGERNYGIEYEEKTKNTIHIAARKTASLYKAKYAHYKALSKEKMNYIKKVLQIAERENIEVSIFLTPLHPIALEELHAQGIIQKRHQETIDFFESLKKNYSFRFYDFITSESFGGAPTDFYDGEHTRKSLGDKVLDRIIPDCQICDIKS